MLRGRAERGYGPVNKMAERMWVYAGGDGSGGSSLTPYLVSCPDPMHRSCRWITSPLRLCGDADALDLGTRLRGRGYMSE